MKKKGRALDILAFICILVVAGLIFIGLKYKSSWKKIYTPELPVTQVETQDLQQIAVSTTQDLAASSETTQVSEMTQVVKTSSEKAAEKTRQEKEKESTVVTVVLRSGSTITGRIEARDDTMLTLQTEAGVTNIIWRSMSTNSFGQLHPELYNRLLALLQARLKKKEEEMLSKGFIQYEGEWISRKDMLKKKYRFSNQRVTTTVRSGQYKQTSKGPDGSSTMSRSERGVLMLSFRGLDPETTYNLKVEGCQFLEYRRWSGNQSKPRFASNTVSKTETLHGSGEYNFEYESASYNQYKGSSQSNYRYGYESDDFMIKIWLDDELIYDKPKGTFGKYLVIDSF